MLALLCTAAAAAQAQAKTIRYHGYTVRVPASWPVYDLARQPRTCVRFDRHAVYLGIPAAQQSCPAHAAGSRRAILLEPAGRGVHVIRSARRPPAGGRSASPARAASRSASRARTAAAPRAHAASVYTGLGFEGCDTPSTQTMSAWSSSS